MENKKISINIIKTFALILCGFALVLCFSASSCSTKENTQLMINYARACNQFESVSAPVFSEECEDIHNGDTDAPTYVTNMAASIKVFRYIAIVPDKVVYVDEDTSQILTGKVTSEMRYKIESAQNEIKIIFVGNESESERTQFYIFKISFDDENNVASVGLEMTFLSNETKAARLTYDFSTNELTTKNLTTDERTNLVNTCTSVKNAKIDISFVAE